MARVRGFLALLVVVVIVLGVFASPAFGCGCPPEPPVCGPGVGTPGYWKNHPEAWPVTELEVGWRIWTKDEILLLMNSSVSDDKALTIFKALVATKLNTLVGNPYTCVESAMYQGNAWLAAYPLGSGVTASGDWQCAEPFYLVLDAYNNGYMCAPPRD